MPSLGADMTEGRHRVARPTRRPRRAGQVVVIVETDKSDIEVEVFQPGTVTELLVAEGEKGAGRHRDRDDRQRVAGTRRGRA